MLAASQATVKVYDQAQRMKGCQEVSAIENGFDLLALVFHMADDTAIVSKEEILSGRWWRHSFQVMDNQVSMSF